MKKTLILSLCLMSGMTLLDASQVSGEIDFNSQDFHYKPLQRDEEDLDTNIVSEIKALDEERKLYSQDMISTAEVMSARMQAYKPTILAMIESDDFCYRDKKRLIYFYYKLVKTIKKKLQIEPFPSIDLPKESVLALFKNQKNIFDGRDFELREAEIDWTFAHSKDIDYEHFTILKAKVDVDQQDISWQNKILNIERMKRCMINFAKIADEIEKNHVYCEADKQRFNHAYNALKKRFDHASDALTTEEKIINMRKNILNFIEELKEEKYFYLQGIITDQSVMHKRMIYYQTTAHEMKDDPSYLVGDKQKLGIAYNELTLLINVKFKLNH